MMVWRQRLERCLTRGWYEGAGWLWLAWPLSLITGLVVRWRRYRVNPASLPVPVVVVGGIESEAMVEGLNKFTEN